MLGGHLDSWHSGTGATDNGAGCAVAMEAMRILKTIGVRPRRTIRVALWTGEEQDYFGSVGYVEQHFGTLKTVELKPEHAKLSVYFNLDNGSGRIRGVNLQGNEAVRPIFDAWLRPFNYLGAATLTTLNTGGTDHMPFDARRPARLPVHPGSAELRNQSSPLEPGCLRGGRARRSEAGVGDSGQLRLPCGDARRDAPAKAAARAAHGHQMTVKYVAGSGFGGRAGRRRTGAQSRPLVAPEAAAIYQRLLPQIARIKIFDHHAHPGFAETKSRSGAGAAERRAWRLRPEHPDWAAAARALFGVTGKAQLRKAQSRAEVLQCHSRPAGHRDVDGQSRHDVGRPRSGAVQVGVLHRPVPVSVRQHRARRPNPDQAVFMPKQTKLLQRFVQQPGLKALPPTFADYLAFVTRVLEDHQRRGAIAAKFEVAYFRSFVFDDPPRDAVSAIYDRYRAGGAPSPADYKAFQDFVFRYVVTECGRLHLPVHIHSSAGAGDYFSVARRQRVEPRALLRDPRYIATTFVLIHGGYPFEQARC